MIGGDTGNLIAIEDIPDAETVIRKALSAIAAVRAGSLLIEYIEISEEQKQATLAQRTIGT